MHRNDRMVSNTVLILNLHITLFVKAQRPLFFLMDIYWIRQTVLWFPWGANKTIDQKYKNVGFIRINHFFLGVNHTALSAYTQPPQMKWAHGETWYLHTHASNYALHIYLYILCAYDLSSCGIHTKFWCSSLLPGSQDKTEKLIIRIINHKCASLSAHARHQSHIMVWRVSLHNLFHFTLFLNQRKKLLVSN